MRVRISGLLNDSIVDGKGLRFVVFAQGCPHACKGCHNPETHDFNGGKEYDTAEIVQTILGNPLLDGVTLSGGEPFYQAEAMAEIAAAVKAKGLNVWTYTGYTYEELVSAAQKDGAVGRLLSLTDVLVDGRFVLEQKTLDRPFAGSKNQRVLYLKGGKKVE